MPFPNSLRVCVASALLLQACATPPAADPLKIHPNLQVRHSSNETAEAYYQLGRTHQAQGNLDTALTGYTYAIARDPRHAEARNAAAAIHAQQGRLAQARAMMLAVIVDYPAASQAYNNLGYIDHLRGDHAGAAQYIRRALELDPHNARALNNLRLVEAALAHAGPAAPGAPVPALPAAAPPPAPASATAARMALVQVVPNVYELRLTPKAAPPLMVGASVLASLPLPLAIAALPPAAAPAMAPVRLDVANGDGTPGLARRIGALFGQHGFPVARLSNERPFGQRDTRIEYRPGYAQPAEALRKLIAGPVVLAPVQALAAGADLRVVLGKNTQRAMAQRDSATQLRLATR